MYSLTQVARSRVDEPLHLTTREGHELRQPGERGPAGLCLQCGHESVHVVEDLAAEVVLPGRRDRGQGSEERAEQVTLVGDLAVRAR
jgi:hypothetical protein